MSFSIFNPSDPAGVQDVNSLIAIGDRYMANMDYENAYKAYSNAYVINPTNSLVIEGLCTSYLFWQIPITNVITSSISGKFESLSKNKFYNVTAFIAPKMATILKGKATSEIAANDMTISVHYFLYNTLYAVFYLADSDGDMNLQNDSNDFITFTNDGFGFSYNIPNQTNFVEVIKLMNVVNKNLKVFRAFVKESSNVLIVIQNSVSSKQAKDFVGQVTNFVFGTMKELNTQLSAFENITGTNQFLAAQFQRYYKFAGKTGFRFERLFSVHECNGFGGYDEYVGNNEFVPRYDEL